MRMPPEASSMSTSELTVGPYFFCRAARMPSWSSSTSSARLSCLAFVSSRNAVRTSGETAISLLLARVPVERQPGLLHVGDDEAVLGALAVAHDRDIGARAALDRHAT